MNQYIYYVDDEPHNLTVFEASLPDDWEIRVFENPLKALEALETESPAVIVSDQKMPDISGVRFLEMSKKHHPDAVRIIVTGYSDEDLVVESVRKAKIYDYIRKPWEPEDLVSSLSKALEFYNVNMERKQLMEKLQNQNQELAELNEQLKTSQEQEKNLREELECWVPPFILWSLRDKKFQFPITKDLVGITFDIIESNKLHYVHVDHKPIRKKILELFSESVLKHGGWRENHSGDSAYAHFGVIDIDQNPYDAALAVAREFRVSLKNLTDIYNIHVECGIALHFCSNVTIDVHTVRLNTAKGSLTQKSFDTSASDIDALHRMEKLVHFLPGSNIVLSKEFIKGLQAEPDQLIHLGDYQLKGQNDIKKLKIIPSSKLTQEDIENFKNEFEYHQKKQKAA